MLYYFEGLVILSSKILENLHLGHMSKKKTSTSYRFLNFSLMKKLDKYENSIISVYYRS